MNAKCQMFAWTLWRVPLGRQSYENIWLFNPNRYSSLRLRPNTLLCKHCSFYTTKLISNSFAQLCAPQQQKSCCHLFAVRYYSARIVDSQKGNNARSVTKGLNQFQSSEMKRLLSLAEPEKWQLTGAIALLLVSSSVSMAVPFALGKVIDLIYTADSVKMHENINMLCITLLGVFVVGAVCNFGRIYLMNLSGQRITRALREKVFGAIVSQEVAFFDQNKTGELVNRLSSDTSLVSQCVTMNISDGLRSLLMVCAGVSMMFYMSLELTLVSLAIVPPITIMAVIYGRFVRKISKDVQDALADASQVAEEKIGNIRTVKSFSQEPREMNAYKEKMQLILDLAAKSSLAQGIFFGMTGLCGNGIVLSVLYYGGVMVSDSTITVGHLAAFLLYAAYIGVSLGGLSSFYSQMAQGLGASTRLWQLIDRQPAIPVSGGLQPEMEPQGTVKFSNVHFGYPNRPERPVLRGLDLEVPSGSVTAVVGASGSGKSTLGLLLLRLYDPQEGSITLDGVSVSRYDPQWLRSHIGVVSQEPVLFSGSVRENILYGLSSWEGPSAAAMTVEGAAREANAWNFISTGLPSGLETVVGERGVLLSGGQKQRIAIARALIKNPTILLLDEATSALDAESEYLVQEALDRIMKGRTVLTIAHRLSTIRNADQIAVLENGRIIEIGTYEQLMKADSEGAFRKLIKHQTFHEVTQSHP